MQIKKGAHLVILKKNIFILQNIENLVNYSEIETVAYQCPMAGGNSVFRARAIYSLMNDNAEYDDQFICLQQGIVYREQKNEFTPSATIYPNPATNSATLMYSIAENGTLVIYNALGQVQLQLNLKADDNKTEVNTVKLTPGVYFYNVLSGEKKSLSGKLTIIR